MHLFKACVQKIIVQRILGNHALPGFSNEVYCFRDVLGKDSNGEVVVRFYRCDHMRDRVGFPAERVNIYVIDNACYLSFETVKICPQNQRPVHTRPLVLNLEEYNSCSTHFIPSSRRQQDWMWQPDTLGRQQ